jgi:F-type H+-transporting ATPase subunit delta
VKNLVIAKRYAKALFTLAIQDGKIEQYGEELGAFVQLMTQLPELADALRNPLYPETARKSLFATVANKVDLSPIIRSYLNLLIEKRRINNLSEISDFYHRLIDEHQNVARAKLSAATKLDDQAIADIAASLEKLTGKKVVVEFQVAPELIGGVVAQIGDLVLDGSVRRQLLNFKETLKRGALG